MTQLQIVRAEFGVLVGPEVAGDDVDAAIFEAKDDTLRRGVGDEPAALGDDGDGLARRLALLGSGVRDEDPLHDRVAGLGNVVDVDDEALEVIVEDFFPQADAGLGPDDFEHADPEGLVAGGEGADDQPARQRPGGDGEHRDGQRESQQAVPARLERGQLVVGREPPEDDNRGEKDRHRHREHEDRGEQIQHQAEDDADVDTLVDDQFHEPQDLAHEQQEGEDENAEEKRGNEFPQQVAIDELHLVGLYGLGDHRAMHAAALALMG